MSFKASVKRALLQGLGRGVTVESITPLSPRVIRVRAQGSTLRGISFRPGDKIKVHVGGGAMRSYTPSRLDPETGTLELVVHVHGDSVGSRWATALGEGDEVRFVGPSRSVDGLADGPPWAMFYGDETAIGLAEIIHAQLAPGTPFLGAISADPDDLGAVSYLPLDGVARTEDHGVALVEHLAGAELPAGDGIIWLSGEASAVLALRAALLERGVPRKQLRIKPYWSVRGKAHRKQLERTVLRQ